MNNFKDLGIANRPTKFSGEKISINRILDKEIIVHFYKIEDSTVSKQPAGKCLYLQIELNGTKHLVFTGSVNLIETIQKVPVDKFPFFTTIKEVNKSFHFN